MKRLQSILDSLKYVAYYLIWLLASIVISWHYRCYHFHKQPNPITDFMLGIGSWFTDVVFPAIRHFFIG